jgi:tetratricopeptide (TPR) repeat protein
MHFSKSWLKHAIWIGSILCCCLAQGQSPDLADANNAFKAGKWVEAERLLRSYLADRPDSADAHYLLANTLFHESRPADSLVEYNSAAHLRRPEADDLMNVALDYVLAHDYQSADKWITEAVHLAPENGNAWYVLGRVLYSEEKFDGAAGAFQEALKRMPGSVKAENNLGLAYEGLYQPEKAIAAYRQAIEWQKNDLQPSAQPYINLGKLLVEEDHADEGFPFLLRGEQLAPGDEKIHFLIGELYKRQGDLKKAQDELEEAVEIDPKDSAAHFLLGGVYRSEGLLDKANAEFALLDRLHQADHQTTGNHPQ